MVHLIAGGHFLLLEQVEQELTGNMGQLIVSQATEVEEYALWKVVGVGPLVGKGDDVNGINERFQIGDKLLAQKSKVNYIRYQGVTFFLADEEFCLRIVEDEQK
jgi:co-chaperonin GroES (HSP10)